MFFWLSVFALLLFSGCGKKSASPTDTPSQVASSAQRNSLSDEHLRGPVMRVTEKKYMAFDMEGVLDSLCFYATNQMDYTRSGWLSFCALTNDAGDTISVRKVTFDEKGNPIKNELFSAAGQCDNFSEYEVDARGFRVKETYHQGDSVVFTQNCRNDANGNVLEISVTQGSEQYTIHHTLNAAGLPVYVEWRSANAPAGEAYMSTRIEYDQRGNEINRTTFLNNRPVESNHTHFDDQGRLCKEVYHSDMPTHTLDIVSNYSDFDAQGNWTKQTTFRNGRMYYVIERKIEYYQ